MKIRDNRQLSLRLTLALTFVLLMLTTMPAAANDDDSKWQLRIFASQVEADVDEIDSDGDTRAESDSAVGFGASLEYRFNRRIGLEMGALVTDPDINIRQDQGNGQTVTASDGLGLTPIFASLNFHLTPDRRFDVYVGPTLAYVLYDDLTFTVPGQNGARLEGDNEFALGLNLGFDAALGDSSWTFGGSAKYLDTTFDSTLAGDDDRIELDVDPIIVSLGFGYRF